MSLAGVPEMHQTHLFAIPTSPILATQFPSRNVPVTFRTAIRITAAAPAGLIFELGDGAAAIAAWVDGNELSLRAGDAAAADRGIATFDTTVDLPVGLELDLTFAVNPGDGRVRIWGDGKELARGAATNGQLPSGWASSSNGAFAAAAVGALPADVTQTVAPTNFDVVQPLSAFVNQVPRHFI